MNRAVFLDRDGTVSEEVGYVNHIDRFRLYPWSADSIRRIREAGFLAFLITNQSGVGRGYFPETLVHETYRLLQRELELSGTRLDGMYYCPHHPDAKLDEYRRHCSCRKPRPGMLLRAAEEWELDLEASFLVGDRYLDVQTAHAAGVRGVMVLSGYGRGEYLYERSLWERPPDHVAENLADATDWIVQQAGATGAS
jgi:D-glycero-D-manno-heptose 1,7-bisphosphate phosphatase